MPLEQDSRLFNYQTDWLLFQILPLEDVPVLVAHLTIVQIQVPPLAQQEDISLEVGLRMLLMIHRLRHYCLEIVREELECPCMHTGCGGAESATDQHPH